MHGMTDGGRPRANDSLSDLPSSINLMQKKTKQKNRQGSHQGTKVTSGVRGRRLAWRDDCLVEDYVGTSVLSRRAIHSALTV